MSDPSETTPYRPPPDRSPERFAAGELLAGRYRVVAPLGKGGMGEVYRADDLTLGQPVALKFLPLHIANDPDRLSRFRKEVAAARRVSHPNVCRVYDITEHQGQSFLTMEFVDGEDLSSLIRRVGRLPEEKGIEIARQLCSALAAVHDQNLLHRDLKPANVMLDGRGRVRLTDFGLAAAAQDLSATEVRSGTPLYMAPEQRDGREVTARSDLYSLGLVLYELFTGRRPFHGNDHSTPPSKPSTHVSGLSPTVEQVILQCLEVDPDSRPRSTAAVLAKLPGGDPLAAAVAAGETPSPRIVADADAGEGRLRPWVALTLVGVVVAGVLVSGRLNQFVFLAGRTPVRDADPAVMRLKAREVLAALGHTEPPGDAALRYYTDIDCIHYVREQGPTARRWDGLGDGRPPAVVVLYRTARGPLVATDARFTEDPLGWVSPLNPPPLEPGMAAVTLDVRGRLLRFYKVADYLGPDAPGAPPAGPDWRPAFAAAGLDHAAFITNPVGPRYSPPLPTDARFAWEGPYPGQGFDRVRVEAASHHGRVVYFTIEFPWQAGERAVPQPTYQEPPRTVAQTFMAIGLPLLAAALAWWNWRAGRANLRGAVVLGGVILAIHLIRWLFTAHHVADMRELPLLNSVLGFAAYSGAVVAAFYLALEPVVRKRWPWRLVGWNRLLAGRVRDPLVARDVLIGLAAGIGMVLMYLHYLCWPAWDPEMFFLYPFYDSQVDPVRSVLAPILAGTMSGLTLFFLLFLVHWACRKHWVGTVVFVGLMIVPFLVPYEPKLAVAAVSVAVTSAGLQFIGLRYGLLAFLAAMLPMGWLVISNWSLDVRTWYATGPNLGVAVLLALTVYCAYVATGGRVLGKGGGGDD